MLFQAAELAIEWCHAAERAWYCRSLPTVDVELGLKISTSAQPTDTDGDLQGHDRISLNQGMKTDIVDCIPSSATYPCPVCDDPVS